VRISILNGLGPALRWLRDRRGKKQYQVAAAAGITKGMLSAYETGRQRPSLDTLDKILETLQCTLNDLHNALQIVNGRPGELIRPGVWDGRSADPAGGQREAEPLDIYGVLQIEERLPVEEERALGQMLDGFHRLVRYMHRTLQQPRPASGSPSPAPDGENEPSSE
jgi:transcriptional regulator with XRE-family HTH domain